MYTKEKLQLGLMGRFISFLEVDSNGCWNWTGNISNYGYGRFRALGKKVNAHTFSYDASNPTPRPRGWHVHHTCENRRCVNPSHLVAMPKREHEIVTKTLHLSRKTHCVNGHPWTQENLVFYPSHKGSGKCRACEVASNARRSVG